MTRYYKVLNPDGTTPQGYGRWPMPVKNDDGTWTPGDWVSVKRPVKRALTTDDLCTHRVLHVVRADQLLDWLGPVIAEVETDGEVVEGPDKCGTRRARLVCIVETWTEQSARHFAADCAEAVLDNVDPEWRETIEIVLHTVRAYADGEATEDERQAAESAALSAAEAAWSAAWSAARSAARSAAESAAWSAAESAAWSAASDRLNALLGIEA